MLSEAQQEARRVTAARTRRSMPEAAQHAIAQARSRPRQALVYPWTMRTLTLALALTLPATVLLVQDALASAAAAVETAPAAKPLTKRSVSCCSHPR